MEPRGAERRSWGDMQMMTRNVLLNMELQEDDDDDGDIGECRGRGRAGWGFGADVSAQKPWLRSNFGFFSSVRSG